MEYICKSDEKDRRFKCHSMAEKYEELLEEWFFEFQEQQMPLESFLCNERLEYCCQQWHYGPACSPCPGYENSGNACFGRGLCNGSGNRVGNGTCNCWEGYVGKICSNCDSNYFPSTQNSSFIECKQCFDGCAGGCTEEGPKGCNSCRKGYEMAHDLGCTDIDECAQEGICTRSNEFCSNLIGSFECRCAQGFTRSESGDCELDIPDNEEEQPSTILDIPLEGDREGTTNQIQRDEEPEVGALKEEL